MFGEYTLKNEEKLDRALNGAQQADSTRKGGVGEGAYLEGGVWKRDGKELSEKDVAVLQSAVLAEYDRLGGLIVRGNDKVKTGSFYDFKGRRPHAKPQVVFVYMINGKQVEVKEGDKVPGIVEAAQQLAEEEAPKKRKK